jgi:predicted phosphate transport protein (TIGR00153 family)
MSFLAEILPERILELMRSYLDSVAETTMKFKEAVKLLNEMRIGEARSRLSESMRKEEEADGIKRQIFDLLEESRIDPGIKEQMFYVVKRIDDIADWFKEAARELTIIPYLETPHPIRDGLEKMISLAVQAALKSTEAVNKVIEGDIDGAKRIIKEVDRLEEEADMANLENRGKLLTYSDNIKPYTLAILLHYFNNDLEEATDACQNASYFLKALIVTWSRK